QTNSHLHASQHSNLLPPLTAAYRPASDTTATIRHRKESHRQHATHPSPHQPVAASNKSVQPPADRYCQTPSIESHSCAAALSPAHAAATATVSRSAQNIYRPMNRVAWNQ